MNNLKPLNETCPICERQLSGLTNVGVHGRRVNETEQRVCKCGYKQVIHTEFTAENAKDVPLPWDVPEKKKTHYDHD